MTYPGFIRLRIGKGGGSCGQGNALRVEISFTG